MVEEMYIKIVDKNKLSIIFGKGVLYIEIYGGKEFANFRVVGLGGENGTVELKVDKGYNEGKESAKCANFIIK